MPALQNCGGNCTDLPNALLCNLAIPVSARGVYLPSTPSNSGRQRHRLARSEIQLNLVFEPTRKVFYGTSVRGFISARFGSVSVAASRSSRILLCGSLRAPRRWRAFRLKNENATGSLAARASRIESGSTSSTAILLSERSLVLGFNANGCSRAVRNRDAVFSFLFVGTNFRASSGNCQLQSTPRARRGDGMYSVTTIASLASTA